MVRTFVRGVGRDALDRAARRDRQRRACRGAHDGTCIAKRKDAARQHRPGLPHRRRPGNRGLDPSHGPLRDRRVLVLSVDTLSRRLFLTLLGATAVSAACSKAPSSASGGTSPSSGSAPPRPSPTPTLTPVPAADRIPQEAVNSAAQGYNGSWKGTWKANGATGTVEVTANIDAKARTATGSFQASEGFFGPGTAPASYSVDVNLDDYAYEMPPYTIQTPLLGEVTLIGQGYGFVQIASKGVTGYPNIASSQSKGYLTGPFTETGAGGVEILPFT